MKIEIEFKKHKFNPGDKVRIKEGISSKTHESVPPYFISVMDDSIGATMTVRGYINTKAGYIVCKEGCGFHEDWLEPDVEELKKGDLAIFWDKVKRHAIITFYERTDEDETCLRHKDIAGSGWENAIKFESKEQFERIIKDEL